MFLHFMFDVPSELEKVRDLKEQSCDLLIRQLMLDVTSKSNTSGLKIHHLRPHVERDGDPETRGLHAQGPQHGDVENGHA